jgi:hypothetical protein
VTSPIDEVAEVVYVQLTGDDEGRVCRDIPEEACDEQPGNLLKHVVALAATKTGDGLADAKLVLSWLLAALGAPAYLIGFLVPIREAGALLPQLVTAARIRSMPLRKLAWAAGSLVQGLAVAGMALAALRLEGATAGWTIVVLLAVMAAARSVCSVSYKDVLGKTVSKSTRGTATGTASSIASAGVLLFGIALSSGWVPLTVATVASALGIAAGLWLVAAVVFSTLPERPGANEGGADALRVAIRQLALLRSDPQLRRFIAVRGLLIATALAPPYLLALAGRSVGRSIDELGSFVVASSLAAVSSTYLWGRLSDVSSRRVLLYSGVVAAGPLAAACALGLLGSGWIEGGPLGPGLLFVLTIAYQGVRLGRSTHIVDMADEDTRAAYTALSNTAIGLLLLAGGVFGFVADAAGAAVVLGIFAAMCLAAALVAAGLDEVQH